MDSNSTAPRIGRMDACVRPHTPTDFEYYLSQKESNQFGHKPLIIMRAIYPCCSEWYEFSWVSKSFLLAMTYGELSHYKILVATKAAKPISKEYVKLLKNYGEDLEHEAN